MLTGRATPEGTARYAARLACGVARGHFRATRDGLRLSSIGLGSYLGEPVDAHDLAYTETARLALRSGVNVLDAAINYRHMRSERALGRALAQAVAAREVARDEVLVCTKGGFIAFDGALPADPRSWFAETYLVPGILRREDVVGDCHAISPAFLTDQIERSRRNLGVEAIDVYYLHNPETQRPETGQHGFSDRLRRAFELLERKADEGAIGCYGLATWRGFRVLRPAMDYLSLAEILDLAVEVGGSGHRLRVIQLPLNLGMTEALTLRNQGPPEAPRCVLELARERGVAVMTSASLGQGRLASGLPGGLTQTIAEPTSDAGRALQFARSAPGVTTALVGTKSRAHLDENLGVLPIPPLGEAEFMERFGR